MSFERFLRCGVLAHGFGLLAELEPSNLPALEHVGE
jgi:hypothetical protein